MTTKWRTQTFRVTRTVVVSGCRSMEEAIQHVKWPDETVTELSMKVEHVCFDKEVINEPDTTATPPNPSEVPF